MRKLAPVPVSHRDDSYFSHRLYRIHAARTNGSHFSSSSTTSSLRMRYPFRSSESDFIPKRVVVLRLHDTVRRFRTGMKFSPRYGNRGLTQLASGRKSPQYHVDIPLLSTLDYKPLKCFLSRTSSCKMCLFITIDCVNILLLSSESGAKQIF